MLRPPHTRPEDATPRSIASMTTLLQLGAQQGLSRQQALMDTRIDPRMFDDPFGWITAPQEYALIRNILGHLQRHADGTAWMPRGFQLASLGVLGIAVATAPSVRHGLETYCRHALLAPTPVAVTVHGTSADALHLTLAGQHIPQDIRAQMLDLTHAILVAVARELVGHAAPSATGAAGGDGPREHARAGMSTSLCIAPAQAALQPPLACGGAHQHVDRQCAALTARLLGIQGTAGRVREALRRHAGHQVQMGRIASALCMSERTLRRRLQEEGCTFQQVVDEVRRTWAEELLADSRLALDRIAERLGYAEAASFIHAFKRWTQLTPREFRRQLRHPSAGSGAPTPPPSVHQLKSTPVSLVESSAA